MNIIVFMMCILFILFKLLYILSLNYMEDLKNKENALLDELKPKISIQDAFKKFQKEKFYQLKLNKYLKNIQVDRTSP